MKQSFQYSKIRIIDIIRTDNYRFFFSISFLQQSTLDRKKKNFSFSRKFPFMKSKDDKSEDGSDQERECLETWRIHRILHVLCMFRPVYIIYCGFLRDNFFFLFCSRRISQSLYIYILLLLLDRVFEFTLVLLTCLDISQCECSFCQIDAFFFSFSQMWIVTISIERLEDSWIFRLSLCFSL